MKKILVVFGTRPEAIKMAPVIKELEKNRTIFETRVCVTAQHREMLDQVLDIFGIKPNYDLDIMQQNQDLYDVTSRTLLNMRSVLKDFLPDIVLVHGDTTTTFTASLASFYEHIKVGHVEAGLRSGDMYAPWPEEINRKLTSSLTYLHFAPTELAKRNLLAEGVSEEKIFVTGNTVIDALFLALNKIKSNKVLENQIFDNIQTIINNSNFRLNKSKYILITGHRRENFGDGFINICKAIQKIASQYPDIDIIYPVHLNPNVQKPVYEMLNKLTNVHLIEPIDYLSFTYLMYNSYLILTDSGGIQEEAPSLGKPVLVMRDKTERPEAIEAGTVKLVGTNIDVIVKEISNLIDNKEEYIRMSRSHNPYGDGKASERIIEKLKLKTYVK